MKRYTGYVGFIGSAAKDAQFAYDRNAWSRHWYKKLRASGAPEEFWQLSMLLTKVVDGRYALWRTEDGNSPVFERFFPTIEDRLLNRIKTWQDKRRRTLFGQTAPDPIFLTARHS